MGSPARASIPGEFNAHERIADGVRDPSVEPDLNAVDRGTSGQVDVVVVEAVAVLARIATGRNVAATAGVVAGKGVVVCECVFGIRFESVAFPTCIGRFG